MKKAVLLFMFLILCFPVSSSAISYFGFDNYGRNWYDADKTLIDDSNMCWAASISNVLAYTGWDAGYTADGIFSEYRDHFKNDANYNLSALNYWFYGSDFLGYIDVPGGGGYYPDYALSDYVHSVNWTNSINIIADIDQWLHLGYGVDITLDGTFGHAVTCYGIEYNDSGDYSGLWIVDNNDRLDRLYLVGMTNTYNAAYKGDIWSITSGSYYGYKLSGAMGLAAFVDTTKPVPEPATIFLLSSGLLLHCSRKRPGTRSGTR